MSESSAAQASDDRASHPRWNTAQASLFVAAVVALVLQWDGYLLVVARRVVPLNVVALLMAIGALWVHTHPRRPGPAWRRRVRLGSVLTLAGALVSGCGTLLYAPSYTFLPTENGCTEVVQEISFLMGGSGTSHHLRGSTGLARETSSWTTDDGARPYRDAENSSGSGSGASGTFGHEATDPVISVPGSC